MFPQRKYIPDEYRENCAFQSWGGVKVVPGLAGGRGVFSTKNFSRGSFICNYGGLNVPESYAEKHMLPYDDECDYLVELREKTCDGAFVKVFVNFDPGKDKTFGQLLNHSSVHPNVEPVQMCTQFLRFLMYVAIFIFVAKYGIQNIQNIQ